MVQIWYPAHDVPSAPRAPYLPDAEAVTPVLADFLGVPPSTLAPLARDHHQCSRARADRGRRSGLTRC